MPGVAKTCVIGEADPFLARLLRRFAETSGLQVVITQQGQELADMVRRSRPEVIVLEAELPGQIRGWEAVRALKADPATCAIPVIVCTWLKEAEARALVGDVSSYLQKPELHYDDFLAALQQAGVSLTTHSAPGQDS
jgi:CheY-like chemotaxis protein